MGLHLFDPHDNPKRWLPSLFIDMGQGEAVTEELAPGPTDGRLGIGREGR